MLKGRCHERRDLGEPFWGLSCLADMGHICLNDAACSAFQRQVQVQNIPGTDISSRFAAQEQHPAWSQKQYCEDLQGLSSCWQGQEAARRNSRRQGKTRTLPHIGCCVQSCGQPEAQRLADSALDTRLSTGCLGTGTCYTKGNTRQWQRRGQTAPHAPHLD